MKKDRAETRRLALLAGPYLESAFEVHLLQDLRKIVAASKADFGNLFGIIHQAPPSVAG